MNSHITKAEQNRLLDKKINQLLTSSRQQSIKLGTIAVSSTVKAKAEKATPENAMEVLADIIKFCETPLSHKDNGGK